MCSSRGPSERHSRTRRGIRPLPIVNPHYSSCSLVAQPQLNVSTEAITSLQLRHRLDADGTNSKNSTLRISSPMCLSYAGRNSSLSIQFAIVTLINTETILRADMSVISLSTSQCSLKQSGEPPHSYASFLARHSPQLSWFSFNPRRGVPLRCLGYAHRVSSPRRAEVPRKNPGTQRNPQSHDR